MIKLVNLFVLSGCVLSAATATTSIGSARSPGSFRVDGATVRGNVTVFDGDLIETATARSVIRIAGVQIALSPQSRVRILQNHAVLENGTASMTDAGKYFIEAATLRIDAAKDSVLRIETAGPNHVAVSATGGSAVVRSSNGLLVASLHTGMALVFDPLAGASTATHIRGILRARGGVYLVTDATTDVTVELRGTDLAKYVGEDVAVTGSIGGAAPAGTAQVIQVTGIQAATAASAAVPAAAAATGVGAAAGTGLSTIGIAAIVGGVGVGGTVAGLAAAGSFSDTSSISRQ